MNSPPILTEPGSGVDAVGHPAGNQGLHQVPLVELVREAQLHPARRVEPPKLSLVEPQVEAGEVVPELLQPPGPEDGD